MKRKIISINQDLCNGCGACVSACHEGALQMVNGKAVLVSDSYCDGLGACLPECPTGAIAIEEREAAAFDEAAVAQAQARAKAGALPPKMAPRPGGCPGMQARAIPRAAAPVTAPTVQASAGEVAMSELRQWPVQIKLVPVGAPYFDDAKLLIAADCTAFAYAKVHADYMRGRITLIGCPKLDDVDYSEKLAAIFAAHDIRSIVVLRMEVPCCGGIVNAVARAMEQAEKTIPWRVVTIGTDGSMSEE